MILMRPHARLLLTLGDRWLEGVGLDRVADRLTEEDLTYIHHLALSGLVTEEAGVYYLTQSGDLIMASLRRLLEEGLIEHPDNWDETFRWIGSEVILMLDIALRLRGRVEGKIEEELKKRGFILDGHLHPVAHTIIEAYKKASPLLIISKGLAEYLKDVPPGPALKKFLPPYKYELLELESMRLIAFAIPPSEMYTLTGLGQQIRAAVRASTRALPVVLDDELLSAVRENLSFTETMKESLRDRLLVLGYIDETGKLLEAGRHALSASRLYFEGPITTNPSIHFGVEDIETLKTIGNLIAEGKEAEYQLIEERVKRDFPNHHVWDSIFSLMSFSLIRHIEEKPNVYTFSGYGEILLRELGERKGKISAFGVKAITMSRMEYASPDEKWVEFAENESLLGNGFPSKKGRLLAGIASRVPKLPYISGEMREILHLIPYEGGIHFREIVVGVGGKMSEEKVKELLMRLDAQGVVDALPEDIYVLSEPGKLIKRAIQVVPVGTRHVLTPGICRILLALEESKEEKGRRIRIPENLKRAEKLTGLPREIFEEEFLRAKRNRYIGKIAVHESGLLLVEALKLFQHIRDVWEEVIS